MEKYLFKSPGLGDTYPTAECLRGLFALPLYHLFLSPDNMYLICNYASKITQLNKDMGMIFCEYSFCKFIWNMYFSIC